MRNVLRIALAVALFCVAAAAQAGAPSSCPTIFVTGPAGVLNPGDTATFTVTVEAPEPEKQNLQYLWTVSSGEIITGQGTTSVEVRRGSLSDLTAAVEVRGLPQACPNTHSARHAQCEGVPVPALIEQIVDVGAIHRADFDAIAREMNDNPTNQLYVFFGYASEALKEADRRREREVTDYLGLAIGSRARITTERVFGAAQLI